MKDFELPALEYCSLERAARFIGAGCEVEDLIHWAEIGAIKLSHEFGKDESSYAYIEFEGNITDVATKIFNSGQCDDFYINISDYSILSTSAFIDCNSIEEVSSVLTKFGDKPRVKASLRGVWNISKFTINRDLVAPYRNLEFSPMGKIYANCNATINDEIGFSVNDLLASKHAISIILGVDNNLRSLTIERDMPYLIENATSTSKEEISNTVANNRASLIKALLAIHYGDDVANSPRKFIENKDSEICKDFQLRGITIPSGKTVADWLKDADIDFT